MAQSHVVQITEVSMSVEEAVTLPCHSSTNDEPVKFIRWQRGAERVLEMNVSSGNTTYGTGLEGRVSLSSEWRSHGNLSRRWDRTGDAGIVQETLGSYMLQKEQKGFSLYRGDRENRGRPGSHR
uniref:Immunoglobulin V-set domain-containing protein n=1 Tax=Seriola lalandi dorsalis TaxID=1841481 RepID=A0A3B4WTN5_SERLL